MNSNPDNLPEEISPPPLPVPRKPTPPEEEWSRYRLLIICALVLVFFIYIFSAKESKRVQQTTPPGSLVNKTLDLSPLPQPGERRTGPEQGAPATVPPPGGVSEGLTERPGDIPSGGPPDTSVRPGELAAPGTPAPPPLPPLAAKPVPTPVKGEAFTRGLIKIMDDQVNQATFGWRPNSILFGKLGLTDNVNNLQLGVLEVARRTVVVLNESMSRFALTEAQNPYVNNAMNFFMVSPEKYWFPSASGKYREAMANLDRYIDDLKHNRSRFYTRVDNLIVLMNHFRDLLGSAFHNLVKDTEADGSKVSWFVCDDYFYFAQGVALGMAEVLEGVKEDFADQLLRKNSMKLVEDAITALRAASELRPWVVTNASKDGIMANHRANMATYIGHAEHMIFTLMSVLATN